MEPVTEIALLKKEIDDLKQEIHELKTSVTALVDAWKTANGVVDFVKWVSGAVAAIALVYGYFKGIK